MTELQIYRFTELQNTDLQNYRITEGQTGQIQYSPTFQSGAIMRKQEFIFSYTMTLMVKDERKVTLG